MSERRDIQKIIDRLTYNEAYAPDFPAEDRTSLKREEDGIQTWLNGVVEVVRREDVAGWLRLGASSVTSGFEKLRNGDRRGGRRELGFAIEYMRRALSKKPFQADFIVGPDGPVRVDDSGEGFG